MHALEKFLEEDRYLLRVNANERSLTHRVAIYLQQEFPDWDVDCEYNRDEHEVKELYLPGGDPEVDDGDAQTVHPDVVVHKRGAKCNYLVIEFKKTSSGIGEEKDFLKLRAFREQLGYKYALFVEFEVDIEGGEISRAEWVNG